MSQYLGAPGWRSFALAFSVLVGCKTVCDFLCLLHKLKFRDFLYGVYAWEREILPSYIKLHTQADAIASFQDANKFNVYQKQQSVRTREVYLLCSHILNRRR